ncbi:hypothetical protein D5086_014848 [Populus alba]|uniref:Uncharacterized protein n=3 Tax=Populus TaxID=3689 RepID=A0ACC4BZ97_POPAL
MSEVEFHEEILEKALKCVRDRKRAFLQEIANDTGGVMGSSSHSLNGPPQIVPTSLVMDAADRCNGVETFNQPQTLAGIMQSPGMLQGYAFPSNNTQNNGDSSSNVFMPSSDLNASFSRGKNTTEQGSGSTNAVQSSAGDPAMSGFAAFSRHHPCGCGPFPL